jgi:hypothetical protein
MACAFALACEFGLVPLASAGEARAAKTAIEPTKIDCATRMGFSPQLDLRPLPSNKNNLAIFGQRRRLSLLAESLLNKRKWRRRIVAGSAFEVGFTSQGETLEPVLLTLFGAACGARAAHVVKFGPIGISCHLKQALPALGEVAKRNGNQKGDQHCGSQCDLPRTDAKGTAKTSSPKSSLA